MNPDAVILDVSFSQLDKIKLEMMDFVDDASYALGNNVESLDENAVLFFICKKYSISDELLNTTRYQVIKEPKKIRVYPLVWGVKDE